MQGKAALHDLANSETVDSIVAADQDLESLQAYVNVKGLGARVACQFVDAADRRSIDRLMARAPDVVVDLLPIHFIGNVCQSALEHGVHLVNTFYAVEEIQSWAAQAEDHELTFLPEFGLDPGIDLILLGEALRQFDHVESVLSYGAGLPEPAAAHPPLHYKVSWTFEGVLKSYMRTARLLRGGHPVEIEASEIFAPKHIHTLDVDSLGPLEAYPNGDAMRYARMLGLREDQLQEMGRYACRWPGHGAFWKALVDLHLLDEEPVAIDGYEVDRKRFLAAVLEPQLQYENHERDLVLVRVEVTGRRNGKTEKAIYQVLDFRDLETGLTAMSRTVGFTASIGAQMIASGAISQRGLLSPLTDIPYEPFARELERRGIQIESWTVPAPVSPAGDLAGKRTMG